MDAGATVTSEHAGAALHRQGRRCYLLIFASPFALLAHCWRAAFLTYDDGLHIFKNSYVMGDHAWLSAFTPVPDSTYFPLALISHRLDRVLFASWLPGTLGTADWAAASRLHTCVYHALAALVLWRILIRLKVSEFGALILALIFALHPTACETVCWASERKNAMAGFFGLLSVWALLAKYPGRGALLASLSFYILGVLCKPSAFGLLPLLGVLLLAGGADYFSERPAATRPPLAKRIRATALFLLPFVLVSLLLLGLNLAGHAKTLVPPPGGSLYTALLTDASVLCGYLFNTILPVNLSFVYYVAPFTSALDPGFLGCCALLATAVGGTLYVAPNRRRAALGWAWFILALTPNLNLVSILQIMQDRYLYLSLPGILLVLYETACGIAARLPRHNATGKTEAPATPRYALGIAAVVLLGISGVQRGEVFGNIYRLFDDAVRKQPLAAHARFGLALAFGQMQILRGLAGAPAAELQTYRRQQGQQAIAFMEICPDRFRQPNYADLALDAGNYSLETGNTQAAEKYFTLAMNGLPAFPLDAKNTSEALRNLALLRLKAGRLDEARALATRAIGLAPDEPETHFVRACAIIGLLQRGGFSPEKAANLKRTACDDLVIIPEKHAFYSESRKLLQRLDDGQL